MDRAIAWRLFRRELQQGQLMLIILAIALAVLSVSGLTAVSDRLQTAIEGEASKFIAADRLFESPEPINDTLLQQAQSLKIDVVPVMEFNSMVFVEDDFQLVTVKAVGEGYPLKGEVELASGKVSARPATGQLWYDSRLAGLLGLTQHQSLELGMSSMLLAEELRRLPDGGFNPFASAPVLLMNIEDVAATEIIQPGSRVKYVYQLAGESDKLTQFHQYLKPLMTPNQRWIDTKSGDSPIAKAIVRAEKFLLLASLLGIALACTAIGIAAQRYCQRHYDVVAMLKTFGASKQQIRHIFVLHLSLVTVCGIVLGLIGGKALDLSISQFLPPEISQYPVNGLRPIALGAITGLISAFMFSAYPLLRLLSIPPLRVLQNQLEGFTVGHWLHFVFSLTAMALLGYLYSGSLALTFSVVAGAILLALLLAGLGLVFVRLGHSVGMKTTNPLQLAFAGLRRRAQQNLVQLVGFATALVLLLIILALRNDLLNEWQSQLPEDAPNYFVINIAPEDEQPLVQFLQANQVEATESYPVVRARLTAINGEILISRSQQEQGEQGRVGFGRELNITGKAALPPNNTLVAGAFHQQAGEVSIEEEVLERLDAKLGDVLTFTLDNQEFDVTISSVRKVEWESLQPNFFMILHPEDLAPFAYTSMLSFHLDSSERQLVVQMIQQFPTLAVIDVDAMIKQLRSIVDQVSLSLTLVLLLVVLASILVLFAQTEAGMATRQRELAVLRTFGGSGFLLKSATALEFALLGMIAGAIAVIVSEFSLWLLKTQVFNLQLTWHVEWWLLTPIAGGLLVGSLGMLACRQLLNKSCKELLSQ